MGFFQKTQERVRNSRGKRAISVRATEILLYIIFRDSKEKQPINQEFAEFAAPFEALTLSKSSRYFIP